MALPQWPEGLPFRPLEDTLSMQIDPNIAEFQPDVGDSIRRRRYTVSLRRWRGTLLLSGQQRDRLLAFFEHECLSGTAKFMLPDWRHLTYGTAAPAEYRFAAPPDIAHRGADLFLVQLQLISEDG